MLWINWSKKSNYCVIYNCGKTRKVINKRKSLYLQGFSRKLKNVTMRETVVLRIVENFRRVKMRVIHNAICGAYPQGGGCL